MLDKVVGGGGYVIVAIAIEGDWVMYEGLHM